MFGGTFDPPHKGHSHLLKTALRQEDFDRVLLMPSYIPPHKDHRPTLSFEARRGILSDWFGDIPKLEISDLEQKREGRSYTVETVRELERLYPDACFYLLIGSDMFLSFERWYCSEELLQKLILVVGSRETGDRPQLEACKKHLEETYACKGILLCEMEAVVCASSTLRAAGEGLAEEIMAHIGKTLDEKRLRHTMQVADYARELAPAAGVDPDQAYLAGLLHDCTKCFSKEQQLSYAAQHGIVFNENDLACPQVFHQYTAPVYAAETFGIKDAAVLSAIGCHTTGKCGFSPLEMLIFFADSCEPSRTYSGVDKLRQAGENNLKEGTLMLLNHVMASLIDRNQFLHPATVNARNYLLKELEKNG
ncbi:MAG: bis(5'-nucleosyl)-tetraphosphatase (symmetrical) YqeK [Clostridia bacterium]|nr:bis(5'-nucleosyl)-tetraphosphatase (symmetrical) YqeK [Clostridia bacterium]